ncbi:hypothetical protein AGMMS49928_27840 [Spirochaetia bacterium]|nr:hypothetical protein AGMMS49928_27840 [Spirochaetia bacterium]
MLRFVVPALLLILFTTLLLQAADDAPVNVDTGEAASEAEVKAPFFPLLPLVLAVEQGDILWSPDWPVEFPPDAFRLRSGRAVSITVTVGDVEYRLRRNSRRQLEEFPVLLEGALEQVRARFGPIGQLWGFVISTDPEIILEFPEYSSGRSFLATFTKDGQVYTVAGEWTEGSFTETWYDGEGEFKGFFQTVLSPEADHRRVIGRVGESENGDVLDLYYYDSFGNVSKLESAAGDFLAIYTAVDKVRYWERHPAALPELWLSLQWDERGLLVRLSGGGPSGEDGSTAAEFMESRYDYTLDSRGNWTERRERKMLRRFGALAAGAGPVIKRVIQYGDP